MKIIYKRAISLFLSGMFVLTASSYVQASEKEENIPSTKIYKEMEFPHYPWIGKTDPKEKIVSFDFDVFNPFETLLTRMIKIRETRKLEYAEYKEYLKQFKNEIEIANENQYPELPNGCEIVSCFIVLRYLGYDVDKFDLADNYLDQSTSYYGQDPNVVYMGNPRNSSGDSAGFYCFSDPIVEAANEFVAKNDSGVEFKNATGLNEDELVEELKNDRPVIVWVTLNFNEPLMTNMCWNDSAGNKIQIYRNLHCLVVSGYNQNEFRITDPIYGEYWVDREKFIDIFTKMGSRAVMHQKVLEKNKIMQ